MNDRLERWSEKLELWGQKLELLGKKCGDTLDRWGKTLEQWGQVVDNVMTRFQYYFWIVVAAYFLALITAGLLFVVIMLGYSLIANPQNPLPRLGQMLVFSGAIALLVFGVDLALRKFWSPRLVLIIRFAIVGVVLILLPLVATALIHL